VGMPAGKVVRTAVRNPAAAVAELAFPVDSVVQRSTPSLPWS
jgi:hypothetical protein